MSSGYTSSRGLTKPAPFYRTRRGVAWHGDAIDVLRRRKSGSVQAIITSPPFALRRKKRYGNKSEDEYVSWFLSFVDQFKRVLKDDGSLVIELGGSWLPQRPARSIYQFELLVALVREKGLHLCEEFYWHNKAKIPSPAQWVNIDRVRVKDAVNVIWWLSKTPNPKACNRRVLKPYSSQMKALLKNGYNRGQRPSGWNVGNGFSRDNGGAIPSNLIEVANTRSHGPYYSFCRKYGYELHPARFPREIPEFFIAFLTDPGDVVFDPFGGSNVTGAVAEELGRRWSISEVNRDYLAGSIGRFNKKANRVVLQRGAPKRTPLE